jgi:hypothetical protein
MPMNKKIMLIIIVIILILGVVIFVESDCSSRARYQCSGVCALEADMGQKEVDGFLMNYDGEKCVAAYKCLLNPLCFQGK